MNNNRMEISPSEAQAFMRSHHTNVPMRSFDDLLLCGAGAIAHIHQEWSEDAFKRLTCYNQCANVLALAEENIPQSENTTSSLSGRLNSMRECVKECKDRYEEAQKYVDLGAALLSCF